MPDWEDDIRDEFERQVDKNRWERQFDDFDEHFEDNFHHGLGVLGTAILVSLLVLVVISIVVCCLCCKRNKRGQVIRTGGTATTTVTQPTSYPTQPANYPQPGYPQPGYPQPQPGYPQPQPGYQQPQPGYPSQSGYQVHPPPPQPAYQGHPAPGVADNPPSYDAATADGRQLPFNPSYQDTPKRPL